MSESNVHSLSYQDFVQPFLIHQSHIRGRVVRLGSAVHTILSQHQYPTLVSQLLGEALLLITMLGGNLGSDGILTMQARGDGPVKLLVVDLEGGQLRGYAEIDEEGLAAVKKMRVKKANLRKLMGKGYLAITIDPGVEKGERYQGVVELNADSLTDALYGYFGQSEQVDVAIRTAVGEEEIPRKKSKRWMAGAIMIERMPEHGGHKLTPEGEDASEQWTRERVLMESVRDDELLDATLPSESLLYRLFNEDGVWAYDAEPLHAGCRCSRKKILNILRTIPAGELEDMVVNGKISVNCHFCNSEEYFTLDDIA